MNEMIRISLAYAQEADKQAYHEMQVKLGTSIYQALQSAGWLAKFPELEEWCNQIIASDKGLATKPNARYWCVGVFSQKKTLDYQLRENDRIEIYRPLTADPMNRRKRKAIR